MGTFSLDIEAFSHESLHNISLIWFLMELLRQASIIIFNSQTNIFRVVGLYSLFNLLSCFIIWTIFCEFNQILINLFSHAEAFSVMSFFTSMIISINNCVVSCNLSDIQKAAFSISSQHLVLGSLNVFESQSLNLLVALVMWFNHLHGSCLGLLLQGTDNDSVN